MLEISKLLDYLHLGRHKLFEVLFDLWSVFYVKIYFLIVFLLNLANWLAAYTIKEKINEDLIILHYNVDFGVNLIGNARNIYIIPLLGLVIILINFILLSFFYRQNKFLPHLLSVASILSNLFLLVALASVYLVNFY